MPKPTVVVCNFLIAICISKTEIAGSGHPLSSSSEAISHNPCQASNRNTLYNEWQLQKYEPPLLLWSIQCVIKDIMLLSQYLKSLQTFLQKRHTNGKKAHEKREREREIWSKSQLISYGKPKWTFGSTQYIHTQTHTNTHRHTHTHTHTYKLNHFAVQLKLTQHCKLTTFQLKFLKNKNLRYNKKFILTVADCKIF